MRHKKKLRQIIAFLLCIALLVPSFGLQMLFTILADETLPLPGDWGGEAAIYWDPGEYSGTPDLATDSNASEAPGVATNSNASEAPGLTTDSNASETSDLATKSNSNPVDGLTPNTPVKKLHDAIKKAEKLSLYMGIEVSDVIIYAMNPMIISPETTYTVKGKGVTIIPWSGRDYTEEYIFIIEGGRLSLSDITIRPDDGAAAPEDSVLIYVSSGIVQLGAQVESYGTFVLDYDEWVRPSGIDSKTSRSLADFYREPVIELKKQFDFASDYRLDLHIPFERAEDVFAIKALYSDERTAEEFIESFTITETFEEWELLVEERIRGVLYDTANGDELTPEQTLLTQKSLVARRIIDPGSYISGKLWLDENADGVMDTDENTVAGYPIRLFAAENKNTAIQETKTKEDGTYQFVNLDPGKYEVGIASEFVEETEYLLPMAGITDDNKFNLVEINEETIAAHSEVIEILTDEVSVTEHVNAGLRGTMMLSRLAAGDFINLPFGGNTLADADKMKLVVMEADGDPDKGYYMAYTANVAGLREALWGIYNNYDENKPAPDYVMYFGTNITSIPAAIFNNTDSASGTGDVTFASLQGRVNTLVLTGHEEDPVPANPEDAQPAMAASDSGNLISVMTAGQRYFGCNIILRNIQHSFNAGDNNVTDGVYMNGYSLTLGHMSWQTAITRYFGGASTGEITPDGGTASITVYSTGTLGSYFIGGMREGTLYGNAEITIRNTSGNNFSVRGGGKGTSASAPANITGSVTTTITGMATGSGGLELYAGGVEYGNVSGPITNTITGPGRFMSSDTGYLWGAGYSRFVGGSLSGDIGSDATLGGAVDTSDLSGLADTSDYIIKNNIDTSEFSFGRVTYYGTNYQSGMVKGNVVNLVRAGADKAGSLNAFSGGSSSRAVIGGSWASTFTVNSSTAKVTNVEAGLNAAKATAKYQLYGNITNVIYQGSICSLQDTAHWFRGAGWGYMEGNAYSEVGTEGVVYWGSRSNYSYSTTNVSQGYNTHFDLVAGGGDIDGNAIANNGFCIIGDTTLVTRNVLARYTYGGSFGGVQVGDSLRIHYGGVVDTCEGTGYISYIHVGDGRAEVHGGQVDWFLTGGGWWDTYQDGNVSVEVFDQPNVIINASMGGTYGYLANHYISGDSDVVVRGGNFSGTARYGVLRGFSSGPSNNGYILGNTSVTLDLRGNQHGFSIEARDSISGGRRLNAAAATYLGTDEKNTITLNIMTDDAQTDLLNGLNIYGDCALADGSAGNTRSGKIIINVNAPGAIIGNLYATSYSNLVGTGTAQTLRRDVEVNLVSADTLTGLCAGNGTENITNEVAANSAVEAVNRKAVINVGPQSADPNDVLGEREFDQTDDGLPHRINISTGGIIGFTSMDIRQRLLVALNGNIQNGKNATAANHGTSYHEFGELTLHAGSGMAGAGLGISSSTAIFIAGSARVEGKGLVYIQSTGKVDQIVLTDLETSSDNALEWLKVGNEPANTNLQTNWFRVSSGWRVITLNPDKAKAQDRITPVNFRGAEAATGKTFIGDSDTHFNGNNGYAVAILGSVYDWEVIDGEGTITHNVPVSLSPPSAGDSVSAYGTVGANIKSVKGSIAIPSALIPDPISYPMFSFIPDYARGEQVEQVDILGSDQYTSLAPHNYRISGGEIGETKTWTASGDDKEYSFRILAQFIQGEAEVSARDVIITEEQALAITSADDVISYTQASGAPLFQNDISVQKLEEIRTPLGESQIWRPHIITYSAGNEAVKGSYVQISVHLIVVRDETSISADRLYAIYAHNATMKMDQAQSISNQTDLDSGYTNAIAIQANGTTAIPTIDDEALTEITNVTTLTVPKNVPVSYSYAPDAQSAVITKNVIVHIEGPDEVEVTISKQVKGEYGDRTRDFTFRIYFQDSSGAALANGTELIYLSSIMHGFEAEHPVDGTLILDSEGSATFMLKHGQQMTIVGVPRGKVRLIETPDPHYTVSFEDSGATGTIDSLDTGIVELTAVDRTFSFTNTRRDIVPTGIGIGNTHGLLLLVLSVLLLSCLASAAMRYYRRKRSGGYD